MIPPEPPRLQRRRECGCGARFAMWRQRTGPEGRIAEGSAGVVRAASSVQACAAAPACGGRPLSGKDRTVVIEDVMSGCAGLRTGPRAESTVSRFDDPHLLPPSGPRAFPVSVTLQHSSASGRTLLRLRSRRGGRAGGGRCGRGNEASGRRIGLTSRCTCAIK